MQLWLKVGLGVVVGYLFLFGILVATLNHNGHDLAYFSVGSGGDAWEYNQLGLTILQNGRFELVPGQPEFFRTPGYPLFLATAYGITQSVAGVVLLQILLIALIASLIVLIAKHIGYPKVGVVAALLFAFDPTSVVGVFMTLSDIFFVAVLLALTYLCMRPVKPMYIEVLLFGVGGGLLVLTKPTGLFVLPILLVWFAWTRYEGDAKKLLVPIACVLLVCVIAVVPWVVRNHALRGVYALSSVGPYNFLLYNIAEFKVAHEGKSKDTVHAELVQKIGIDDNVLQRDLSASAKLKEVAKAELSGKYVCYAIFHIEKTIPYYIGSSYAALKRALSLQGVLPGLILTFPNISGLVLSGHIGEAVSALLSDPWALLERVFWALVILLDITAVVLVRGKLRTSLIFFALLALLFGALTGPVSFTRYRLPAEPYMLLAAGVGVSMIVALWKSKKSAQ
jgi:4-amino-4-deoxy-L-arabinose transferase-like glycosyltransferase